ncbi:MAG: peptidylprolyl isomerase [Candidatus Krumholzibacteriia bacterium]
MKPNRMHSGSTRRAMRHGGLGLLAFGLLAALAACDDGPSGAGTRLDPPEDMLFGDGTDPGSPVIARVDGFAITQRDLEKRREEFTREERRQFEGDSGDRLLIRAMVDEALLAKGARDLELYKDPSFVRTLVMNRRVALVDAMRNLGLLKGREPSQEELRQYFLDNRDSYMLQGTMNARHIETGSREQAEEAYAQIMSADTDENWAFRRAVAEYSTNAVTRQRQGDLGWFNPGGFIGGVEQSKELSSAAWELQTGVNPPIQVGDRWHVIQVLQRQHARPMTFEEAFERVKMEYMPRWQGQIIGEWLRSARAEADIEFYGDYRPGQGKTPAELFERAQVVQDLQQKISLLDLLVEDYPESDLVDDALFLAANLLLDTHNDQLAARRYLRQLLRDHPGSDYADDAQYIIENMGRPNFRNPQSIEDLRG